MATATVVASDSGTARSRRQGGLIFRDGHPEGLPAAPPGFEDEAGRLAAEGRRRVIAEYVDDAIARKTLAFWRAVREKAAIAR
jgi:hypothetical protein